MPNFDQALRILSAPENLALLNLIKRGIEKESLRVTTEGKLSQSPHPNALGSALTHPRITTDFSEALLELITPPGKNLEETLAILDDIHKVVYHQIGDELLWVNSMPCAIGEDKAIPIARYGSSNVARMKEVYRLGLGNRYGRTMQTIAGIHYNWSAPDECLSILQTASGNSLSFQEYKTQAYFGLIRNFRRHTWLLLYLFGAAPAICRSFVKGRQHRLTPMDTEGHTLYAPYGTSLRMGDLGYQSSAQESLYVCYNDLDSYIKTLQKGLAEPYEGYAKLGTKDANGDYVQLNTHLLQIENEFYSTIRPKRTTRRGETPMKALRERGVEYIEVRCIDLNPFEQSGLDKLQARFLDIFLLNCLLRDSPAITPEDNGMLLANQLATVYEGRKPGLTLQRGGQTISLTDWAEELFEQMKPVAELLDANGDGGCYQQTLSQVGERISDPEKTPSARILAELKNNNISYFQWGLKKSREHKAIAAANPPDAQLIAHYDDLARQSEIEQRRIEEADDISFEEYLARYYSQHQAL